jgi:hypothetical protein
MGANSFVTVSSGANPQDAFSDAVEQARWESGHGGYSGTIAEKRTFSVLPTPGSPADDELAAAVAMNHDHPLWLKVDDKWGPAGCIKMTNDRWMFFGWASS